MKEHILRDRGLALEEIFFRKEDEKLLQKMRAESERCSQREALSKACGIHEVAVLDTLVSLGIDAEMAAAFGLVPLIEIAWAEGHVEPRERTAVLSAATAVGIESGSPALELLGSWLDHRPEPGVLAAWEAYARALVTSLDAGSLQQLRSEVLGHARTVAEAAGGFLGLGNKVSKKEEAVLARIERALT